MRDQELFRIFVNSCRQPRDPAEEQRSVKILETAMNMVCAPLSKQHRLYYALEVDPETLDQWLVVRCHASLQRELFEQEEGPCSTIAGEDPVLEATVKQAIQPALMLLKAWSTQAPLSQDVFISTLYRHAPEYIGLLAKREDSLNVRTPDGLTIAIEPVRRRPRTMLDGTVSIRFRVDMLGLNKASIELTQAHRLQLHVKSRHIELHWLEIEQEILFAFLFKGLKSRSLVEVEAYPIVNRYGETVSLSFKRISTPTNALDVRKDPTDT